MTVQTIDDSPKCDDRDRPVHVAGQLDACPTCIETRRQVRASWKPPRWQLECPDGSIYDYDRKPANPIMRVLLWWRGYRWHRYPWLGPRGRTR